MLHAVPWTCQVTVWLAAPSTVAANCCVPEGGSVTGVGNTVDDVSEIDHAQVICAELVAAGLAALVTCIVTGFGLGIAPEAM